MNRLRKAWRFIHTTDHPFNCDVKWAKDEWFMWAYAPFAIVGLYTGWISPSGIIMALLAFIWATMLFFTALNRQTSADTKRVLEAYGELADDQTRIISEMRDTILAYRLRDDFAGEGWKSPGPHHLN